MFLSPRDAAEAIFQQLERVRAEPDPVPEDAPASADATPAALDALPSRAHLRELLEISFFASLTEEEGRASCFAVGYLAPSDAASWPHVTIEERPLSVDTLRRLAPAADPATTTMAVYPRDGRLVVWGLVPHGRTASSPLGLANGLRVVARARGRIDVGLRSARVASLSGGELLLYDTYLSRAQLASIAARLFPGWSSGDVFTQELFAVLEIAREMVALSHGGTLLVVADGPLEEVAGLGMPPRYAVAASGRSFLHDRLGVPQAARSLPSETATGGRPSQGTIDVRRRLRERAAVIAHLAAVDGAVVLTAQLELLAFGAMIEMSPSAAPVELPTIDPATPTRVGSRTRQEFGGARHQAAIAFCRAQTMNALALVVSQDGTLSAFLRDEETVLAIRPLDVGLARFGGRL